MPTPAELRDESRQYRHAAEIETTPEIRRRLANHALVLAQLAEKIEREETGGIKRSQGAE
ncbi:MAG TPA: hypothetical protein VN802_18465 [Stellaceae bacterium]|nr:hypothetical protein [Stellaceae bacterium]